MKKLLVILLIAVLLLGITGCGQKTLHCDKCGTEVKVQESSNMEEDWLIYCDKCGEEVNKDLESLID